MAVNPTAADLYRHRRVHQFIRAARVQRGRQRRQGHQRGAVTGKCLGAVVYHGLLGTRTELTVSEAERLCDENIWPYMARAIGGVPDATC
jgi:hypothetical protein